MSERKLKLLKTLGKIQRGDSFDLYGSLVILSTTYDMVTFLENVEFDSEEDLIEQIKAEAQQVIIDAE